LPEQFDFIKAIESRVLVLGGNFT